MAENDSWSGLSSQEALNRLKKYGYNDLDTKQDRTLLKIVGEVVREPMFLLLLSAGGIYLLMGEPHEAMILLGFVFIIIAVTVFQERRTEKVLEALRDLSSPRALVIRDGKPTRIAGREVARGDIVVLAEGDRVPADGAILRAHELSIDESMLTGESVPVAKNSESDAAENLVYAGTLVVSGQCIIEVATTGAQTELGKIGKSLQNIEVETSPLQHEMANLTNKLAIIGVTLCALATLLYIISRGEILQGVLAGITLAMGILPQEFPVIMIIFMAFGARRIAASNVLTRRLGAIETLGETTVLCVDKTGTLTQNKMSVASLYSNGLKMDVAGANELPEEFHLLLEYCLLASEIDPHDPMEKAFHSLALRHLINTEHIHKDWNLTKEYELTPAMMAMSHIWSVPNDEHQAIASKGAPEAIIDLCHLSSDEGSKILEQASMMADRGLRVLGVARAVHKGDDWPAVQHDFNYEFLGLVGLSDPLRSDVPDAVRVCHGAGIRIVMITGDYPQTAKAIAKQAGINDDRVLTGVQISGMSKDELTEKVKNCSVFARVTPQQKLSIVEALKANGEIVAMTGDGVNDAPALKSAHIGIAMGERGTDVAREAASLVLLKDDFGAIVEAIKLGRRIFANLRKAMIYTLAVHMPIIGLSILPLLFGLPLILAPIHIAFLELVIDPACSVVFEAQDADKNTMQIQPRSSQEPLVSSNHIALAMLQGILASTVLFGFYWLLTDSGVEASKAKALLFVTLIAANTVLIFSSKSAAAFSLHVFSNVKKVDLIVVSASLLSLFLIATIPAICGVFMFSPLGLFE